MILASARSAIVSVTVQNVGGDTIHHIGSTIGTAMRGSLSGNVVGTATASFSIIEGERLTLINVAARLYLLRLTLKYLVENSKKSNCDLR